MSLNQGIGRQKITAAEAAAMRQRAAQWRGPRGDFVAGESARYLVTRETIRRILRGETHMDFANAATTELPPIDADVNPWAHEPANAQESAERLLRALVEPVGDRVVDALREAFEAEDPTKLG